MKRLIVGIDFDNTIVSYDSLAQRLFRELFPHVPVPSDKTAVREYLRSLGKEDVWTEMQGTLYGARICEAECFEGFIEFIEKQTAAGHAIYVVSHKTRRPYSGPQYDLHRAAWDWLHENGVLDHVSSDHIFFEETKSAKLKRVLSLGCSVFIDDLPEILLDPEFPPHTIPILFDPKHVSKRLGKDLTNLVIRSSWFELHEALR